MSASNVAVTYLLGGADGGLGLGRLLQSAVQPVQHGLDGLGVLALQLESEAGELRAAGVVGAHIAVGDPEVHLLDRGLQQVQHLVDQARVEQVTLKKFKDNVVSKDI